MGRGYYGSLGIHFNSTETCHLGWPWVIFKGWVPGEDSYERTYCWTESATKFCTVTRGETFYRVYHAPPFGWGAGDQIFWHPVGLPIMLIPSDVGDQNSAFWTAFSDHTGPNLLCSTVFHLLFFIFLLFFFGLCGRLSWLNCQLSSAR